MTFLNPSALFGLFAALVPIAMHLFNLRKLKKIEFSSIKFLKELQKRNIRKIKIKNWLLLLLRTLIIALIVLAFSRPAIKGTDQISFVSEAKSSIVIIIDDSPSMSLIVDKGSLFNQAKKHVKMMLDEAKDGDDIYLIFSSKPEKESALYSKNPLEIKKMIDNKELSGISSVLQEAIETAGTILKDSRNLSKEAYVFSDFQKSRLLKDKKFSEELSKSEAEWVFCGYKTKDVYNIGAVGLYIDNQIIEKSIPIKFICELINFSQTSVNNAAVSLFINGIRKSQKSFNLFPNEKRSEEFEITIGETGIIEAYVEIENDDLEADNRAYISFYVPEEILIGLFADDEEDLKYIEAALKAYGDETKIKILKTKTSNIDQFELEKLDASFVILSNNAIDYKNLYAFLKKGGGAFIAPGEKVKKETVVRLFETMGLPAPKNEGHLILYKESPTVFGKIDFSSPVLRNIFEDKNKQKMESPRIFGTINVQPSEKGKNIISLLDGVAFFTEFKIGEGKLIFLGSPPTTAYSDFPLKGAFAPIIVNTALYLSSKESKLKSALTGDKMLVDVSLTTSPQIIVKKPNEEKQAIEIAKAREGNLVVFNDVKDPGFYRIYSNEKMIDHFSANIDPKESDLTIFTEEELYSILKEKFYLNKIKYFVADDDFMSNYYKSKKGSELWKLLLMLTLALALIETAVSKASKKDFIEMKTRNN